MQIETKIIWDTNSTILQGDLPIEFKRAIVQSVFRRFLLHPLTIGMVLFIEPLVYIELNKIDILTSLSFALFNGIILGAVCVKASTLTYIEEGLRTRTEK